VRTLLGRFLDHGAVVAGWVGAGMAAAIVVSFVLVIPVGDIAPALFALPGGLLIGYYANQRSERWGGPWVRLMVNGLYAALVTGLVTALLLLAVKAVFFTFDDGYPVVRAGSGSDCQVGADCVYRRYLAAGEGPELARQGVVDAASFSRFYWSEQAGTATTILVLTVAGGLGGAVAFGLAGGRRPPAG
jgi:hypothetical protein